MSSVSSKLGIGRSVLIGLGAGVALAAFDITALAAYGVRFAINEHDASAFMFLYLASSFAGLGAGLGWVLDARRREKQQLTALRLAEARLSANDRLASLGQLAAAIAHEVRNPLAIIRSSVQNMAEALPPSDPSQEGCRFVISEIDRLSHVTQALLGFVRPIHVHRAEVPVADLFGRTLLLAEGLSGARERKLLAAQTDLALRVSADPDLLTQVLLGLVTNAIEMSPLGGRIELAARSEPHTLSLSVSDEGPGVAEADRQRIFDPLFTTKPGGNGLGLAVAKQIATAHGGSISVETAERGGARFVLKLPLVSGAHEAS